MRWQVPGSTPVPAKLIMTASGYPARYVLVAETDDIALNVSPTALPLLRLMNMLGPVTIVTPPAECQPAVPQ
jgi:hypothetical protein